MSAVTASKAWCRVTDDEGVWRLHEVSSWENGKVTASTGEEFQEADAHPFDPSHEVNHSNLADMDDMHEAPLVHLLQRRFAADEIYTFTGDILISVNPYKPIHGLYRLPAGPEAVRDPAHAPHLYVVADRAYQSLAKATGTGASNQALLVCGESGAGKTEASKYIMQYLAMLSHHAHLASSGHAVGDNDGDAGARGLVSAYAKMPEWERVCLALCRGLWALHADRISALSTAIHVRPRFCAL